MKASALNKNSYYLKMKSPLQDLYLIEKDQKLVALVFEKEWNAYLKKNPDLIPESSATLMKTKSQLQEYFAGKRKKFDLPLLLEGTDFQKKAWKALIKIPYGKTVSYKEQALLAGKEKAIRAIGSANGCNQIPIIIPCHRVIASDGGLGGYSGGLSVKTFLLRLEKNISS